MSEIDAVVISAGSMKPAIKTRHYSIDTIDVYTTAGTNGQISSALETLPGFKKWENQKVFSLEEEPERKPNSSWTEIWSIIISEILSRN